MSFYVYVNISVAETRLKGDKNGNDGNLNALGEFQNPKNAHKPLE